MPSKNINKNIASKTIFPQRLRFLSDDNEIELKEVLYFEGRFKLDKPFAIYVYTKSKIKFGFELRLSEEEVNKIISRTIAIEI